MKELFCSLSRHFTRRLFIHTLFSLSLILVKVGEKSSFLCSYAAWDRVKKIHFRSFFVASFLHRYFPGDEDLQVSCLYGRECIPGNRSY